MKLEYCKETANVSRAENEYWQSQIQTLESHNISLRGLRVTITFEMYLTMVDGKVISALTETASSQRCVLCGVTPKDMNDLQLVRQLSPRNEHFQFGLSTLHAWIRLFECIVHIGYRKKSEKVADQKCSRKRGPARTINDCEAGLLETHASACGPAPQWGQGIFQ